MEVSKLSMCLLLASLIHGSIGQNSEDDLKIKILQAKLSSLSLANWIAPEEIRRNYTYYLSGFDPDNKPIWIAEFGKWDLKSIIEGGGQNFQNFDKYINQGIQRVLTSPEMYAPEGDTEDGPHEFFLILDFEQYDLLQLNSGPTIAYIVRKARELRDTILKLDVGYCINVNYLAQTLLNLVKPIFGKDFDRIEILGTNKQRWLPKILSKLPRSQLPEWYGGKKIFKPFKVFG